MPGSNGLYFICTNARATFSSATSEAVAYRYSRKSGRDISRTSATCGGMHENAPTNQSNRRPIRFREDERRPVSFRGFALAPGLDADVVVSDLSYNGCKVASSQPLKSGRRVELRIGAKERPLRRSNGLTVNRRGFASPRDRRGQRSLSNNPQIFAAAFTVNQHRQDLGHPEHIAARHERSRHLATSLSLCCTNSCQDLAF
jgi:hypothetical protein